MSKSQVKESISLAQEAFGEPIKYKNSPGGIPTGRVERQNQMGADAMVSQFINIKKNYHDRLRDAVGSDRHARRYLCRDDCAYIFDYRVMKTLVKAIEKKFKKGTAPKGAIFIFQGLKKATRINKPDPNDRTAKETKEVTFGKPTIIAAAYYEKPDGDYHHIEITTQMIHEEMPEFKEYVAETYDGFQHPGNGNSGNPANPDPKIAKAALNDTPVVLDPGEENDDTDYLIKRRISVADMKTWLKEI